MNPQIYDALNKALSRPIAYHRAFREITGSTVAALFLSQAWYWKDKSSNTGWFWKTRDEWEQETGLSRSEQETARKKLTELGFIEEKRKGIPAKMFYRVNTEKVIKSLLSPPQQQLAKTRPTVMGEVGQQDGEETSSSDEGMPPTFLYTENTHRVERESFPNPSQSLDEQIQPEASTPQPPSFDMHAELAKRQAQEKARWSPDRPQQSAKGALYPWNLDRDPRKIDPDFVAYLVRKQVPWIFFNYEQRSKLDEETVIAHCRKLISPDKRDRYEPDLMEAWGEYARERDEVAAKRDKRAKAEEYNRPENNAAYRRFSEGLGKFPDKFRCEVASHSWDALRVNVWYKGVPALANHPLTPLAIVELAMVICRRGARVTPAALQQRLGLDDWDQLWIDRGAA